MMIRWEQAFFTVRAHDVIDENVAAFTHRRPCVCAKWVRLGGGLPRWRDHLRSNRAGRSNPGMLQRRELVLLQRRSTLLSIWLRVY
jgi:hypothetical protein